jgi:hypothetical protein
MSTHRKKNVVGWKRIGLAICIVGLVVSVGLAVAGCSRSSYTHTIATNTEYYLDGPQQARPPDGTLPAGTAVRLVSEAGSYSLVETPDRLQVYVATDSLRPLR